MLFDNKIVYLKEQEVFKERYKKELEEIEEINKTILFTKTILATKTSEKLLNIVNNINSKNLIRSLSLNWIAFSIMECLYKKTENIEKFKISTRNNINLEIESFKNKVILNNIILSNGGFSQINKIIINRENFLIEIKKIFILNASVFDEKIYNNIIKDYNYFENLELTNMIKENKSKPVRKRV